ncbi:ABC transporter substrate-binding protein [Crenobacter cavernae]|uniref:ABC transporter substrate-binding protein n=1 Tax=Crenobacter cavernae TaxID=2290923 RepID=A0ABY0FEU5_9NEIS|nr:transporter substrate-binding domain-containing protein [Crenobacter cavernae]RXZ43813.1 ABC transporter substrate-binding protein [Crenobacter cavernae]
MPKRPIFSACLWIACSLPPATLAAPVLRIGVGASDGPPIVMLAKAADSELVGGLYKELGDALAKQLGATPEYVVVSRNRVESNIERNKVDIHCNANPRWFGNAARLGWTRELYPQIERVVTLKGEPNISSVDQLAGKRVGTILGFHYPPLEPMWKAQRASRVNETRLDLMLKAVLMRLSDAAIPSELEYVAWARANPLEARALKVHPMVFTTMPTMCAVAPKGNFGVAELNRAIDRLEKNGQIKAILSRYQWQGG